MDYIRLTLNFSVIYISIAYDIDYFLIADIGASIEYGLDYYMSYYAKK